MPASDRRESIPACLARTLQKVEDEGQDLLLGQVVGGEVEVAVGAGVAQAVFLLVQVGLVPVGAAAPVGGRQGQVEVDEQIGRVEPLPHVGHVGVILGGGGGVIAQGAQPGGEGALA